MSPNCVQKSGSGPLNPIRVFFAQPVDGIAPATIAENIVNLKELTSGLPIEIITPYKEDILVNFDRESARRIVERDYLAVETCDVFLADISKMEHQFVGIFFEMAYAVSLQKTIIIYSGLSTIDQRTFVVAHANFLCKTWHEVLDCLKRHRSLLQSSGFS